MREEVHCTECGKSIFNDEGAFLGLCGECWDALHKKCV